MPKRSYTDPVESKPPAGEIPGAIAQTQAKIAALRDGDLFEEIAVVCLRKFTPSLRRSGGPGDQQRDAVGGSLMVVGDELVVTASVQKTKWAVKIEKDLDGLKANGHTPEMVWAVTSVVRPGAERRTKLEKDAKKRWGHGLKIIDGHFLALRLLDEDMLDQREELLGLGPPTFPITRTAQQFSKGLTQLGAPQELIGRDGDLDRLVRVLSESTRVELVGKGGLAKPDWLSLQRSGSTLAACGLWMPTRRWIQTVCIRSSPALTRCCWSSTTLTAEATSTPCWPSCIDGQARPGSC